MATLVKNSLTVSAEREGLVVLPLSEYRRLLNNAVPTVRLSGRAAARLDKLVEGGIKDYRQGRTKLLRSLADLS